jgi:hypothetical protein
MYRRRGNGPSSGIDWLPWGLSIFGALCAVFVLIRGVLPERSANRELVQQVARLETDLSRAKQDATEEVARAKDKLVQQVFATQAEVSAAREQERLRAAREAARRDLGQSLASQIEAGDVVINERSGELSVVARGELLFSGNSSVLDPKGKRFLRELAVSIHRLPAEQVYRIGGKGEKHQRAVSRFLESAGRVPHAQLATAGAPPAVDGRTQLSQNIEIVLVLRKR